MLRTLFKYSWSLIIFIAALVAGSLLSHISAQPADDTVKPLVIYMQEQPAATETIPPSTPLATVTPRTTLKPAPTFEPPTQTPYPSATPSVTPTTIISMEVSIPGLNGAESPTPTSTAGCVVREAWKLTYTVVRDDALASIADRYSTSVEELMEANCLTDSNFIVVGQVLHVPGDTQPYQPEVECVAYKLLTPANGTQTVAGDGNVTFNWVGPLSPKNLIRIYLPDGTTYERVVELRQNEQINANQYLRQSGTYTWYVYPLDNNFQQITGCREGGPWTFIKSAAATYTPTATASVVPASPTPLPPTAIPPTATEVPPTAAFITDVNTVPLIVNFTNQSSGNITRYEWNFGDGVGTSADQNPSYTYAAPGTYTVTLTVYNSGGSNSVQATLTVN